MMHETEVLLAGWPVLIQIVVGVALSFIASRLVKPKSQTPFQEAPTPLTTRGARVPIVMGRRVVRPIFAAVGDRYKIGNDWFEKGVHILCMGPATALHAIQSDGKGVLPLLLTPLSHPSGTLVGVPGEGEFRIYWGETDQPLDLLLTGSTEGFFGLPTNLPGVCYIIWANVGKRLGQAPIWDQLRYEVEVRIQETGLLNSAPYYLPPIGDLGTPVGDWFRWTGTSQPGWLRYGPLFDNKAQANAFLNATYPVNSQHLLEGTPGGTFDGTYAIGARQVGGIFSFTSNIQARVRLSPVPSLSGVPTDLELTLTPLDVAASFGGVNPAHAIYQLLFGGWPWGLELDQDAFDMDALEDLGVLFAESPARVNVVIQDGETVEALLTKIMREHGIVRHYDRQGRIAFAVLRPDAPTFAVPSDALLSPLPEVGSFQGPRPIGRINFKFSDIERNWADNVIDIGDDVAEEWLGVIKERDVEIYTAIDYATAAEIADRRAPEELGDLAQIEVAAGRQARDASIGQVLTVDGIPGLWRILGRRLDTLSSGVDLTCIADPWGEGPSDLGADPGVAGQAPEGLAPDVLFSSLEIPPWWGSAGAVQMAALRVRNSANIDASSVFVSNIPDGSATQIATGQGGVFGGVLSADLPADTIAILGLPWGLPGPLVVTLGPATDILIMEDLLTNEAAWKAGEQVCVIGGGPDAEVCHLQRVQVVGESVRLEGLSRARYDTIARAWPAGTPVWMGPRAALVAGTAASLVPLVTRYLRAPVATATEVQPLAEADEAEHDLEGKGVRPIRVRNLRIGPPGAPRMNLRGFTNGQTFVFSWSESYGDQLTGAGFVAFGDSQAAGPVQGDFLVEFRDSVGNVTASEVYTTRGTALTYAELFTDSDALVPTGTQHSEREFSIWVYHRFPAGTINPAQVSLPATATMEPV